MKRTWIRLYTDVPTDPKVQRLESQVFKFWINCLCLAGHTDGVLPSAEDLAWALKVKAPIVEAWLDKLVAKELLDEVDGKLTPHGWNERQYVSDLSNERVRKHRERHSNGAGNVTRNASATPSEAEQKQKQKTPQTPPPQAASVESAKALLESKVLEVASCIHARHPPARRDIGVAAVAGKLRTIARGVPAPERVSLVGDIDETHAQFCVSDDWTKDGGQYAKGLENWLAPTKQRWATPPPRCEPSVLRINQGMLIGPDDY